MCRNIRCDDFFVFTEFTGWKLNSAKVVLENRVPGGGSRTRCGQPYTGCVRAGPARSMPDLPMAGPFSDQIALNFFVLG